MAGMNIHTATEKILVFLKNNLTDPLTERTSSFIYSDGARIDLDKSGFPKILLKKTEQQSDKQILAMGNTATENTDLIFAEVKTMVGAKYVEDKDTEDEATYTGIEFASLIAQRIDDLIKSNREYFITNGFLDVTTPQDIIEVDRDKNPTYRLGIQMHYISTPN